VLERHGVDVDVSSDDFVRLARSEARENVPNLGTSRGEGYHGSNTGGLLGFRR